MTNSKKELNELRALQREASKLRSELKSTRSTAKSYVEQEAKITQEAAGEEQEPLQPGTTATRSVRKRSRSTTKSAIDQKPSRADDGTEATPATQDTALEEPTPTLEKAVEDLNVDFNAIVKEIQEAARERPALAMLAAFSIGVVVGHLFSRR